MRAASGQSWCVATIMPLIAQKKTTTYAILRTITSVLNPSSHPQPGGVPLHRGQRWGVCGHSREVEHPARVLLDDQRALVVGNVGEHLAGPLARVRPVRVAVREVDLEHDPVDADGVT